MIIVALLALILHTLALFWRKPGQKQFSIAYVIVQLWLATFLILVEIPN